MFDLGFTEILLVGIVALLVFGPEELPRVARTVGHVLGRMRRYVADVKADINREMEQADLKQMYDDVQASAQEFKASIDAGLQDVERSLDPLAPSELVSMQALADEVPAQPVVLTPALSADPPPAEGPVADEAKAEPGQPDLFAAVPPRKEV